jgi:hypothetical protein
MATIQLDCDVTEYDVIPTKKNNSNVIFCINERSLVINFTDIHEKIIMQSEISIEDARKLAKLINL